MLTLHIAFVVSAALMTAVAYEPHIRAWYRARVEARQRRDGYIALRDAALHLAKRSCWGEYGNIFFWLDYGDYLAFQQLDGLIGELNPRQRILQ